MQNESTLIYANKLLLSKSSKDKSSRPMFFMYTLRDVDCGEEAFLLETFVLPLIPPVYRSSRSQMSFKIGVQKNFAIFIGKHLCWSLFLIQLQAWRPATLLKRDSNIVVCSSQYREFFRTVFQKNTSGGCYWVYSKCCITFSWIELQILLSCCLININIVILRYFSYLVCLCPSVSRPSSIYVVSVSSTFHFHLHFIIIKRVISWIQTHLFFLKICPIIFR